VLVVEDDESLREVVSTVLEMEGYHVVGASTAAEAMDGFEQGSPSLILLDITVPGMDVETFAAEIGRQPTVWKPRIIVLTADAHGQQIAEQIGAVAFLAKPFAIDVLVAEVARACALG
jgi:CheY-like chemotaxis protein